MGIRIRIRISFISAQTFKTRSGKSSQVLLDNQDFFGNSILSVWVAKRIPLKSHNVTLADAPLVEIRESQYTLNQSSAKPYRVEKRKKAVAKSHLSIACSSTAAFHPKP
jgi:hypothetical protein